MVEAEEMSKRVFDRLNRIFQQLHDVDAIEKGTALRKCSDMITHFYHFLFQHERYDFVMRAVLCLQVTEDVLNFHEVIDQVESALGLPQSPISIETAGEHQQQLLKTFRDICDDSEIIGVHTSNDRARLDAITLLRNVLTGRKRSNSSCVNEYWEVIETLEAQFTSFSSDPPDVVVADWFVPPYQVKCEDKLFSQVHEHNFWEKSKFGFFFVCDYVKNGTLPEFLKKGDNKQMAWEKLHEIALGLQYLHRSQIIHGDLKGNNLLVPADGTAKLTDFGLSLIVANSSTLKPAKVDAPRWRAPEVLKGESISVTSDIYAFGMCIVEAVSGEYPWGNALLDATVRRHVKRGTTLERPGGFTDSQWEIVTKMIVYERSKSIKIAAAVDALDDFRKGEWWLSRQKSE
ncbi:Tkl protein kinase, partial [Globisporangium splendens]